MCIRRKKGISLVEAVISCALFLAVISSVTGAYFTLSQASHANTSKIQAHSLAEEGIEAIRIIRDRGYTANIAALTSGTTYYLEFYAGTWKSTTTSIYVDGLFSRSFVLSNVYRDGSQNIAPSGTLDANIKKVTVSVAWRQGTSTTTESLATYVTNIFSN